VLSIIATPIGNLGDITLRAIETLKKVDGIICEDTRVTGNLLTHLELPKKELISYHGYSDDGKVAYILRRLEEGQHLALVSDCGTPGISDPGNIMVSKAAERGVTIEVIPGPAAFLTALSGSGLPIHEFNYLGFLPIKKGRQTLLKTFIEAEQTIVFYESVHRITKTLSELATLLADQPTRNIVIARELTKMHEQFIRTTISELPAIAEKLTQKGEFVIILGGRKD
jgi:16S rRNA (cytidine1402-2'-O)-methyltransferase